MNPVLYSTVCFVSSAGGYVLTAFVFNDTHKRTFFIGLFIMMAASTLVYMGLEGYRGFFALCRKNEDPESSKGLRLIEETEVEKTKKKNTSLFEPSDQEPKKEQYINCNTFYGKYFTGDTFSTSTPFVIY